MDNIIGELVSIEEQARQIARKAHDCIAEYKKKTETAITDIRSRRAAETEARVSEIREAMEVAQAAAIAEIARELEKAMDDIAAVYKEKRDGVKLDIFKRITVGEPVQSKNHAGL